MSQPSLRITIEEASEDSKEEEAVEIVVEPALISKKESVAEVLIPESVAVDSPKIEESAVKQPIEAKRNDEPVI
jgi:hypothetical protein